MVVIASGSFVCARRARQRCAIEDLAKTCFVVGGIAPRRTIVVTTARVPADADASSARKRAAVAETAGSRPALS